MLIYLINLLIITGLLLLTGKDISLTSLGHDFVENTKDFVQFTKEFAGFLGILVTFISDWISDLWKGFGK